MSAQIIPTVSAAQAQALSSEDGHDCKCRKSKFKERPGRDFASDIAVKKEAISIDLGPLLKDDKEDITTPVTVFVNCGTVPVEERRYWDVTIYNSNRTRRGQQYKTVRVDETSEESKSQRYHGVFRIVSDPKNDILSTVEKAKSTANLAQHFHHLETCSEAKLQKLAEGKRLCFRILFHPQLPNIVYAKQLNLWIDQVPLRLRLRGFSIGPAVCLTRNLVNFGGVYVGNRGKHVLEMHNHSLAPARFHFPVDNARSIFKVLLKPLGPNICPSSGVIQPFTTIKIDVTFHPFAPRSFYKRAYCLVHHQDPIVIDFVGVCVPRARFLPGPIMFGVKLDPEYSLPTPINTFDNFLEGDQNFGITFDLPRVNFGYRNPDTSHPDHSSSIPLNAINSLPYDVLLEWTPDPSKVFTVAPAYSIVQANHSRIFYVNFKPSYSGTFYDATLECYVYPTGDAWPERGPPWKLTVSPDEVIVTAEPPIMSRKSSVVMHGSKIAPSSTGVASLPAVQETSTATSIPLPASPSPNQSLLIRPSVSKSSRAVLSVSAKKSRLMRSSELVTRSSIAESAVAMSVASSHHAETTREIIVEEISTTVLETETQVGNGFEMKVTLSRLNEGHDTEFMVSPVGPKINHYYIPEMLSLEDDANRSVRTSRTPTFEDVCGSNLNVNDTANNFREAGKLSMPMTPSGMTRGDYSSSSSENEIRIGGREKEIPSVHPSHLIMPGNDVAVTKSVLDGIKKVALPMCITLKVSGHTFSLHKVPFIPNVKLSLKSMMHVSLPDSPVGRTILIKNLSDLPSIYDLEGSSDEGLVARPSVGLIHGNQHEIIVVRVRPAVGQNTKDNLYKGNLPITFNLQDNCLVGLNGYCEVPQLRVRALYENESDGNEIICPITIPGCVAYAYVELQNPTAFHYRFWIEPANIEDEEWMIITPNPSRGFIGPNEAIPVSWRFAPHSDGSYYSLWRFCFDVVRTACSTDTSLGFYEFIMPVVGASKTSSLMASPSLLDFDLIQIFDPSSKTFTVKNEGECDVNAHFVVNHEQWLTSFPPEMVTVSPSKISLKPQESIVVTVTVRPARADLQRFYIIYNFEFSETDEFVKGATLDVFEKHLVDIIFMGDHTICKVTDIIMDSRNAVWDPQQCWSMFSISMLNQLLTPKNCIAPEGIIPRVPVVCFRFPAAPINTPTSVFKLHLSNVSDLKAYWQVFKTPPKGWSKLLKQKINGLAGTTEYRDEHFTDSPELLSHLWARKFNYHAAIEGKLPSTLNNVLDMGLIEFMPTTGLLQSKESSVITVKYAYSTLGAHQISVLLRVFPAIFIWLDISGITLGPNQPNIQFMDKKQMDLHPVTLSDLDPPIQMFWMYNGGNAGASYSVDLEPLEKLKDGNFGHAVIECLTPKGKVDSKSWSAIKLRFSPLEYTNYSAPLKIHTSYEKKTSEVRLYGNAIVDPAVSLRPACTSDSEYIRKFALFAHGVPVTLSPSHVSIGHIIPTGHTVTSVVFLTNTHVKNTMKFHWESIPLEGGGLITFIPDSGRLGPMEEISIQIIIQAGDTSAVLDTMSTCTIEDESRRVSFESAMDVWQDAMKNMQGQKESRVAKLHKNKPEKPEIFTRLLAVSIYIGTVFGQYDHISSKEKSRIAVSSSFDCKCGLDTFAQFGIPFTYDGAQFCGNILKDIIWDMTQSSTFRSFVRMATRRKAPLFEEYVDAEIDSKANKLLQLEPAERNKAVASQDLDTSNMAEILEKSIFNIVHELAERYSLDTDRAKWSDIVIAPIQAKALMDEELIKKYFKSKLT